MMHVNRILFPTDYSPAAEHAFAQATFLAERFHAALHILNVVADEPDRAADGLTYAPARRLTAKAWAHAMPVFQVQMQGRAAPDAILAYADAHDVDLIVMGTHGRRGTDRPDIGAITEAVVRRALCPVLTIRSRPVPTPGPPASRSPRRILVPLDVAAPAGLLLGYAQALAALYESPLDLLHVIDTTVLPRKYGVEALPILAPEAVAETEAALLRHVPTDCAAEIHLHVRAGSPAAEVLAFVQTHGTDLIVLATHSRNGLRPMLPGSTAEVILRRAPCPVFAVKRAGKTLIAAPGAHAPYAFMG